ncbi:MAG: AraC family transcriptional regulator [Lachnospiraceae bacterium]|nr:AraC family transcriptional regulator [Lachnospiraceae bacterium]
MRQVNTETMDNTLINVRLTEGTMDEEALVNAKIILPCDLPVKVYVGGRVVTVDDKEAMFIPPGTVIGIYSSYKRREIDFNFDIIKQEPSFSFLLPVLMTPFVIKDAAVNKERIPEKKSPLGHILPVTGDKKAKKIIKEDEPLSPIEMIGFIYDSSEKPEDTFSSLKQVILLKTLFIMLGEDALLALSGKDTHEKISSEMVNRLSLAVRFINSEYEKQITLDDIATSAGYARAHMSHVFKAFYGISLFDYLNSVRAHAAAKLLLTPGTTPHEAAEKSGFTSSSNFNRVFKDVCGCAPREYMKFR